MDVEHWITAYAAALHRSAPYREPTDTERKTAVSGLSTILDQSAVLPAPRIHLDSIGITTRYTVDSVTGRRIAILDTPPDGVGWGVAVVDLSAPVQLVVEVPHPNFDLHTELPGVGLFRRVPGSVLLVAGAHRRAAGGTADVAHAPGSMFNAWANMLAERDLPQIQLHGFTDAGLPGVDVVTSTGSAAPSHGARQAAALLDATGFRVCRAWDRPCGRLEGTTNVQGDRARRLGTFFLHVELNRTVRDDEARWRQVVTALAGAGIARPA